MTHKQFTFSLFVGGLLVVLGAAIFTRADIGMGLLGLGLAIVVLALFTREPKHGLNEPALARIPVNQAQNQNSLDT